MIVALVIVKKNNVIASINRHCSSYFILISLLQQGIWLIICVFKTQHLLIFIIDFGTESSKECRTKIEQLP